MASSSFKPRIKVEQHQVEIIRVREALSDNVAIALVQIPAGEFMMGAPEGEEEASSEERPEHRVRVGGFWMGQYPITQAEWRVVASLGKVNRDLKPDPAYVKGDRRPVERVSWFEAVEFCDRISQHTGRHYRLPSEAEWEYACRGGTTTPFHFGPTLLARYSNFKATEVYGPGKAGEYRQQTTPVDQFEISNRFGLCDMHGNVWEWCQDHWHKNYDGAPDDGRAWLTGNEVDTRVLRGGSWLYGPGRCRSAARYHRDPGYSLSRSIGFRVVLSPR